MKRLITALVITVSSCLGNIVFAEETGKDNPSVSATQGELTTPAEELVDLSDVEVPKFWDMVTNLPENWAIWADETFAPDNYGNIIAISALTAILVATDYETWQESKRLHDASELSREIHIKAVGGGDGYFHFFMALSFAGWGHTGNKRALRTGSQIVEAMLGTGALIQIVKHITGRQSPFKTDDTRTGRWEIFPEQVKYTKNVQNYDAVPSGHIATAFSTFWVIKENYSEQKWIPWVGYPVIAIIAQGLAGTSIHWWSDIPLGIAFGYHMAEITVRRNKKGGKEKSAFEDMQMVPVMSASGPVMGVQWQW